MNPAVPQTGGVLRGLFGTSQEEVWRQLCAETGAELVKGGFWKGDKVVIRVKDWTVTLDCYVVSAGNSRQTFTRLRAPYVNPEGFRFLVYRKTLFSALGKYLGMQDVDVGFPQFDENFVIKGNDEAKLRSLFANEHLRELLSVQPSAYLQVKDDEGYFGAEFPEGVDELHFQARGMIKDVERLKSLYKLFAVTLTQLCRIGSAYENDPGVEL